MLNGSNILGGGASGSSSVTVVNSIKQWSAGASFKKDDVVVYKDSLYIVNEDTNTTEFTIASSGNHTFRVVGQASTIGEYIESTDGNTSSISLTSTPVAVASIVIPSDGFWDIDYRAFFMVDEGSVSIFLRRNGIEYHNTYNPAGGPQGQLYIGNTNYSAYSWVTNSKHNAELSKGDVIELFVVESDSPAAYQGNLNPAIITARKTAGYIPSVGYEAAYLTAVSTNDISAPNHSVLVCDSIRRKAGTTISYNSSTGDLTLKAGGTYRLKGYCGYLQAEYGYIQWTDVTNGNVLVEGALSSIDSPTLSSVSTGWGGKAEAIVSPQVDTVYRLEGRAVNGNSVLGYKGANHLVSLEVEQIAKQLSIANVCTSHWEAGTYYQANDIVIYNDALYRSNSAHLATTTFTQGALDGEWRSVGNAGVVGTHLFARSNALNLLLGSGSSDLNNTSGVLLPMSSLSVTMSSGDLSIVDDHVVIGSAGDYEFNWVLETTDNGENGTLMALTVEKNDAAWFTLNVQVVGSIKSVVPLNFAEHLVAGDKISVSAWNGVTTEVLTLNAMTLSVEKKAGYIPAIGYEACYAYGTFAAFTTTVGNAHTPFVNTTYGGISLSGNTFTVLKDGTYKLYADVGQRSGYAIHQWYVNGNAIGNASISISANSGDLASPTPSIAIADLNAGDQVEIRLIGESFSSIGFPYYGSWTIEQIAKQLPITLDSGSSATISHFESKDDLNSSTEENKSGDFAIITLDGTESGRVKESYVYGNDSWNAVSRSPIVTYSGSDPVYPQDPIVGDMLFVTANGQSTSTLREIYTYISEDTGWIKTSNNFKYYSRLLADKLNVTASGTIHQTTMQATGTWMITYMVNWQANNSNAVDAGYFCFFLDGNEVTATRSYMKSDAGANDTGTSSNVVALYANKGQTLTLEWVETSTSTNISFLNSGTKFLIEKIS
jgi:hypothetical protein